MRASVNLTGRLPARRGRDRRRPACASSLWLLFALLGLPTLALADQWAGSGSCHGCHRENYASWHRTFHRTMTQEATSLSVQGRFDGQPVRAWGMEVRPQRRGEQFWFDYHRIGEERPFARYRIERTVGSHRYQQYLTREEGGGTYFRLHLLWHNEDQRWAHMNAAFLGPDQQDFDANVSIWNHNCIFCHNTGPEPGAINYQELRQRAAAGEDVRSWLELEYESSVAELGIACEACHGPAAEHVERQSNWFNRLRFTLTGAVDDSIVQPQRLEPDRANQVCGQCHGQRMPIHAEMLREFISDGPPYRAGGQLFESVQLVWPETPDPITGHPGPLFALRFWPDRTPRLTAYELQGLTLSRCHEESDLTCMTCHTMHGGDRQGMIREDDRGNRACLGCHQDLVADVPAHTHHGADSEGSNCYSCHMPKLVYGVMEIHRSHRIEIPDPAAHAAAGRPNACNLCHVDQSVAWAERHTALLWGRPAALVERADRADPELADGLARLYAGDPVERAVTAVAIGRAIDSGLLVSADAWRWHLVQALADDYPAVRRFALRALGQRAGQPTPIEAVIDQFDRRFDFIGSAADRSAALADLMARFSDLAGSGDPGHLPDGSGGAAQIEQLRAIGRQRSEEINIGE